MKNLVFITFLFFSFCAYSQDINKCGLDTSSYLTKEEANYLNKHLVSISIKDCKFIEGDKVLFITGLRGEDIGNKKDYFATYAEKKDSTWLEELNREFILMENEKEKLGGYDFIVTYWVKAFSKSRKKKIIRKLDRRQRKKVKHEQ